MASATAGAYSATVQASGSGVTTVSTSVALSVSTRPAVSIAVVAGDNQTIAAGLPVPVAPRVVVRDAEGLPVAGVSVTFARDSGSSQLTDSVRVTAADGVAQLGAWLIGPGRNVIRASAASLPAAMFHAIGTGAMTIGDQTIASGGGTITVTRPGDPLNGLQLTIPAQAYGEPVRVVMQYGEMVPVPGRAGTTPIAPPITISGNREGVAAAPLIMRIPARVPRNAFPVAVIRNLTTGEFRTAPAVAVDSQTVMVVLETVDGSLIGSSTSAALRAGSRSSASMGKSNTADPLQKYALQTIIGTVPYTALTQELNTGYVPAVDNWEFDQLISRIRPWDRYSNGLPLLAAWYFDRFKSLHGALYGRFQKAAGVDFSDVQGLRLADQIDLDKNLGALVTYAGSLEILASSAGIPTDSLNLLLLKVGLHQTGRPQLVRGRATGKTQSSALLVYRASGNSLDVTFGTSVNGNAPIGALEYSNGKLSALSFSAKDFDTGEQQTITLGNYIPVGIAGYSAAELNGLWQQAFDEKVGEGRYPAWHFASSLDPNFKDDTIWVAEDSVRFWVECKCEFGWTPGPGVTSTDPIATVVFYVKEGDTFASREHAIRGNGVRVTEDKDGTTIGLAIGEGSLDDGNSFIDWTTAVVKVRRLTVTPDASTKPADTPFTLTADISRALPNGATWEWELGDGRTVTSSTKTLDVEYPPPASGIPTTYTVKARIKSDGKTWASGKTTVKIEVGAVAAWRITSISDADSLFDDGLPPEGVVPDLLTRPGSAIITIDTVGDTTELRIRVRRTGTWADTVCCPIPVYNPSLEKLQTLGTNPPTLKSFGPYFAAWNQNGWSQSTSDLNTGTIAGRWAHGTHTYKIKDAGSQLGPEVGILFTGTRAGKTLSGTITLTAFYWDTDTGEIDSPPTLYRFPFTAVRMR